MESTTTQQPSSGLQRFRSAPSSFLSNFNENGVNNSDSDVGFQDFEDKSSVTKVINYGNNSCERYCGLPPHYPKQNNSNNNNSSISTSSSAMESCSFGLVSSNPAGPNSSPPGFFGNLSLQNGYATKKEGMGSYGENGEESQRLKSHHTLQCRVPSSPLGLLSQISERGSQTIEVADTGKLGNGNSDLGFYGTFPYASFADATFVDSFNGIKRYQADNEHLFSHSQPLSHHLSLPKTSGHMVAIENLLNFQDSVPCKIRAKRGCATHPRSIAERVRRTRISERMRKLQGLVPNMDKQTNTADMLDLAVDYIKELQKQYKILRDNRANCKCSSEQKPVEQ